MNTGLPGISIVIWYSAITWQATLVTKLHGKLENSNLFGKFRLKSLNFSVEYCCFKIFLYGCNSTCGLSNSPLVGQKQFSQFVNMT